MAIGKNASMQAIFLSSTLARMLAFKQASMLAQIHKVIYAKCDMLLDKLTQLDVW